jgi:malate dehydrogenase (oxaloacetate-decarboxylating)(NADP+)
MAPLGTVLGALLSLRDCEEDIQRYLLLRDLQRRASRSRRHAPLHAARPAPPHPHPAASRRQQPPLFYRLLLEHTEEVLPYVYTPTVGDACLQYHRLPLTPVGVYLRATDRGRLLDILRSQPQQDVR